jgi:cytochrome c oxidase assembly protein subunit 15
MVPKGSRAFARATWVVLAFTLAVVAWGGLVRASRSGDGCGANWPTCNGELFPTAPVLKTRIEFTHRVMSGASLLFTAGLAGWALLRFPAKSWPRRGAATALAFSCSEAFIGAAIVLLRLVGADSSLTRVVGMGLHLVSTFFLLGALLLTALWASGTAPPQLRGQAPVGALWWTSLGALLVLGMSGALAALGDTLFPAHSLAEGFAQDASPTAHFLLRLRFLHPLLAAFGASLLLATAAMAAVLRPSAAVRRAALVLVCAVGSQLVVGLVNLALLAPVPLQLVHLVLADIVWLTVVALGAHALAVDAPRLQTATRAAGAALLVGGTPDAGHPPPRRFFRE